MFPSIGWGWAKADMDERVSLAPWTIHDLRRSVATGLREHVRVDKHPVDTHLVELIINHASGSRGGVAGVYDRSERLAERRRALERWADLVLRRPASPWPAPPW